MKVAKGYYADGEDAYEMMKFFKSAPEDNHMRTVTEPIVTSYPGAAYPAITYETVKQRQPSAAPAAQAKVEAKEATKTEAEVEGKAEAKSEPTAATHEAKDEGKSKKKKKHKKK